MSKIKLAVIFGGKSAEYGVSLHSTYGVVKNFDTERYDLIYIGITKEGKWIHFNGEIEKIDNDTWQEDANNRWCVLSCNEAMKGIISLHEGKYEVLDIDCVFPILHGTNGEDGTIQGLFALANIPFVGCDHISSAISMDKQYTHIICEAAGIPMAPYITCVNSRLFNVDEAYEEATSKLTFPMFVKPANAGSSFGISKVRNKSEFSKGLQLAFEYDTKVIVESGVDGFEIGCAVLGNDYDDLTIGYIDQVDTNNDFFDFDAKYKMQNTKLVCPANISETLTNLAKQYANTTYKALGCKGLARIDMFVTKDNTIVLNEINTLPGFTSASRYPTMIQKTGMTFQQLLDRLIGDAMSK